MPSPQNNDNGNLHTCTLTCYALYYLCDSKIHWHYMISSSFLLEQFSCFKLFPWISTVTLLILGITCYLCVSVVTYFCIRFSASSPEISRDIWRLSPRCKGSGHHWREKRRTHPNSETEEELSLRLLFSMSSGPSDGCRGTVYDCVCKRSLMAVWLKQASQ